MYAFVPKNLKKIVIRTVVFTSRQMITARSIPALGERPYWKVRRLRRIYSAWRLAVLRQFWRRTFQIFGVTLLAWRGRLAYGVAWRRVCSVMVLLVYIGANMAKF
jgi:hypothetical protein